MKAHVNPFLLRIRNKFFPDKALKIHVEDGVLPFCLGDGFAQRIWLTGTYEQGDRTFLRNLVRHLHCFVDVGANLGIYTLLAARHVSRRGKVFSFEASRIEFEKLKLTLAWNKLHSVIAEHLAVGDHSGEVTIYESVVGSGALNRIGMQAVSTHIYQESKVQSVSLDDYFRARTEKPDFIKVDVEGFELNVLRGARQILQANRPLLMVEMVLATSSSNSNPELIWDYMEEMKYGWFAGIKDSGEISSNFQKPLTKGDLLERLEEARKVGFNSGHFSRNMYCVPLERISAVREMVSQNV